MTVAAWTRLSTVENLLECSQGLSGHRDLHSCPEQAGSVSRAGTRIVRRQPTPLAHVDSGLVRSVLVVSTQARRGSRAILRAVCRQPGRVGPAGGRRRCAPGSLPHVEPDAGRSPDLRGRVEPGFSGAPPDRHCLVDRSPPGPDGGAGAASVVAARRRAGRRAAGSGRDAVFLSQQSVEQVPAAFGRRCIRAGRGARQLRTVKRTLHSVVFCLHPEPPKRRSALLFAQIALLFSLIAPCQPGPSPSSVQRGDCPRTATSRVASHPCGQ